MKKSLKPALAVAVMGVSSAIGYVSYIQPHNQQLSFANPLIEENLAALAEDNPWQGKKLDVVNCKCSNGNNGLSIRCVKNGKGESCTQTQQGLNKCYSTKIQFTKEAPFIEMSDPKECGNM